MITHMFLTLCVAFFIAVPLACEWDVRTSDVLFRKYGFIETNSIIRFITGRLRPSAWRMRIANQIQITPFVIFGLIFRHNVALSGLGMGACICYCVMGILQGRKNAKTIKQQTGS